MAKIVFPHSKLDWLLTPENTKRAINDILKAININRDYDIPYLAGYSITGDTIYIDRGLELMDYKGRKVSIEHFLIIHETVEKALINLLKTTNVVIEGIYMITHQIALLAETHAVIEEGIELHIYNEFCNKQIERAALEPLKRLPGNLDITPYKDQKDYALIEKMVKACQST